MNTLFWIPGRFLIPEDKICFDEIQAVIDKATIDFLIRPDWEANMACVDLMKANNTAVFNESILYLRRKLTSNNPKVAIMTLRLLESLMTNCGEKFYSAVNDKAFISDMGKTARKFCNKVGGENKEAAEVALDVIQAWGEAFLTKRQRYPNITDLYFDLRKEGLPFKKVQFDSSRVPIFRDSFVGLSGSNTNSIPPAASKPAPANSSSGHSSTSSPLNNHRQSSSPPPPSLSTPSPFIPHDLEDNTMEGLLTATEVISSMSFFLSVVRESILPLNDNEKFVDSEITVEMIEGIRRLRLQMNDIIMESLNSDPEKTEVLLKLNEDSQTVVSVYDKLKAKTISTRNAKALLSSGDEKPAPQGPSSKKLDPISSPAQTTKALSIEDNSLLDLDSPTLQSKSGVSVVKNEDLFSAFPSSSVSSSGVAAVEMDLFGPTQPAVFNDPFAPQPAAVAVTAKAPMLVDPFAGQNLTAAPTQAGLIRPLQPPPNAMRIPPPVPMQMQMQPNPNFAQQGINPMQYPPQTTMIQPQYPYAYPPAGYPAPAPYPVYNGQPGPPIQTGYGDPNSAFPAAFQNFPPPNHNPNPNPAPSSFPNPVFLERER
eukprot:gene24511-31918_t